MKKIITLTMNPAIDTNCRVNQVISDQKLRCKKVKKEPGGGGINVSRAIKKLAGDSRALFTGGGPAREKLINLLKKEKIEAVPFKIKGTSRENLTVFEKTSNKQYRFVMPGPRMTQKECTGIIEMIRRSEPLPDYIVASGSLPQGVPSDFYAEIASLGNNIGAKVIIDSNGESLLKALDQGVFLIKPNMRELNIISEEEIEDEAHMKEVTKRMISAGKSTVIVVSLGAAGAFLATKEQSIHLRAPTVPIKSKVGAGDSMVAGIVLSLARGESVQHSVKYGIAAGAAAVMTPGTELCRKSDTEKILKKMNA